MLLLFSCIIYGKCCKKRLPIFGLRSKKPQNIRMSCFVYFIGEVRFETTAGKANYIISADFVTHSTQAYLPYKASSNNFIIELAKLAHCKKTVSDFGLDNL